MRIDQATTRAAFERAAKRFNRDDSLRHIEMVAGSSGAVMDFRTIPESAALIERIWGKVRTEEARLKFRVRYRGTFTDMEELLRRKNAAGYGIFMTVNKTDGQGTSKENITWIRVLVADFDGSPLPKRWKITPHVIEQTSPGKFQCFWCLEESDEIQAAEDMGRRLAMHYRSDPKVHDAPHVFRLAGFVHQKRKPFTSRLMRVNEFDRLVKLEEFDAFLPKLPPRRRSSGQGIGQIDADAARLLFEHFPVEAIDENKTWLPFAMALHSACDNDGEVEQLFFDFCRSDTRYDSEFFEQRNRVRWNSFKADKVGGVGIGTLRTICDDLPDDSRIPGAILFRIFNDAAAITRDFDNG